MGIANSGIRSTKYQSCQASSQIVGPEDCERYVSVWSTS